MVLIGFYLLSAIMFFTVFVLFKLTNAPQKFYIRYGLGFIIWLLYVTVISELGILNNFSLPPRLPLLIVIPAIVFIIYITSTDVFKKLMQQIPMHLIIYIQSFRIGVEFLIYGAFINGIFPERATFEGINYDILVGISALIVAYLVQKNKIGTQAIFIWNVISLAILTVTVYAFISSYYFSDFLVNNQKLAFIKMPYVLLPAVLLPFAIFYHVVSIRQLVLKTKMTKAS